jgi:hypothetical protein
MSRVEKLAPLLTFSKDRSKRTKMIVEAERRTDENAIRQHATATAAMKMDGAVETDREPSESDESWQTAMNQRSNKIQNSNKRAPMTATNFFG